MLRNVVTMLIFQIKRINLSSTLLFCLQGVHKLIKRQTSHANDFVNAKSRSVKLYAGPERNLCSQGIPFFLKMPKIGVGRMTLNGEKHGDSPQKIFLVPARFLLGCLSFYHHLFLEKMERTKTNNLLNLLTPVVLHKKTVLVKKASFLCKKAVFLQNERL